MTEDMEAEDQEGRPGEEFMQLGSLTATASAAGAAGSAIAEQASCSLVHSIRFWVIAGTARHDSRALAALVRPPGALDRAPSDGERSTNALADWSAESVELLKIFVKLLNRLPSLRR